MASWLSEPIEPRIGSSYSTGGGERPDSVCQTREVSKRRVGRVHSRNEAGAQPPHNRLATTWPAPGPTEVRAACTLHVLTV